MGLDAAGKGGAGKGGASKGKGEGGGGDLSPLPLHNPRKAVLKAGAEAAAPLVPVAVVVAVDQPHC